MPARRMRTTSFVVTFFIAATASTSLAAQTSYSESLWLLPTTEFTHSAMSIMRSRSSRSPKCSPWRLPCKGQGADKVFEKVGSEPTGRQFNSVSAVVDVPTHTGNALVNAGPLRQRA